VKLSEQSFWSPKFGATPKESCKIPTFDLQRATLICVDALLPQKDSLPVVTINVRHPEHSQPIPANFELGDVEVQRRLYETLLRHIGLTLSEIGEIDFD